MSHLSKAGVFVRKKPFSKPALPAPFVCAWSNGETKRATIKMTFWAAGLFNGADFANLATGCHEATRGRQLICLRGSPAQWPLMQIAVARAYCQTACSR